MNVYELIDEYVEDVKDLFGEHLRAVILFGSYARGDFREDSDVDIMILIDFDDNETERYREKLSELNYDYLDKYGIFIQCIVKNEAFFNNWIQNYPFYNIVNKEGKRLYAA